MGWVETRQPVLSFGGGTKGSRRISDTQKTNSVLYVGRGLSEGDAVCPPCCSVVTRLLWYCRNPGLELYIFVSLGSSRTLVQLLRSGPSSRVLVIAGAHHAGYEERSCL
ncbi:Ribosomal Protein S6 Kinase Delta-1 [Manis pentadactyla]|nr:Ribosomal Protein S6 Kinase Delta-1 [Manis pentadactyla]